ncbi:bifunctional lysylphosphatidylglycerol flippase/synthetase MprF [Rathayibacter toxicus]|uniref:bifunctional lysylphosphatidylglycerol flippase/synthetase MprF n=1 Tax=Rathayibacter toxicus TaxID=145458 RepID=UPI0006966D9A|nr:DUF2156 domain-containing protein [Rathayibacter toxicus]ALS57742.1 hypothetical protein APU90_08160 [Rathayibacter toxicus]PPG20586.1 DUF2156 domain-containing protein [Rathayibacter toxicus]PPG45688.1 DUF2156 domain-containing protein [Rathayibacter toxicus]PPH62270.1 DUF2156 domain-containing protein [Rathayibacter toxicus]PPH66881.1 DUF2156 domain-containing protein [Rathayibacter toxicus]
MPTWFPRRGVLLLRTARLVVRKSPAALSAMLVLLLASGIAGTLIGPASVESQSWWAASASTTLGGRPWTAVTALLIAADPVQLLLEVVLLLPLLLVAERRIGTPRTVCVFFLTGAVGITLGTVVQVVGSAVGEWWASDTLGDHTFDPLIGGVGALMAATAFMGVLWRRRLRVSVFAVVLMFVLYAGDSADVYRFLAGVAGLAIGTVMARGAQGLRLHRPVHSSHRESRALLAAIVAVTAIGPLVAAISDSGYGPFSFLGRLLQNAFVGTSDLEDPCSGIGLHCSHHVRLSLVSPGSIVLTFVPLILLVVAAYGLRSGRRLGLLLAIGVNLAIAVLEVFSLQRVAQHSEFQHHAEYVLWMATTVLVPLAVVVVLTIGRRHFRIRGPRAAVRLWSSGVGVGFVVAFGSIVVLSLSTVTASHSVGIPRILIDGVLRFVPVSFLGGAELLPPPHHVVARTVFEWMGPLFWLLVVIAVIAMLRETERQRIHGDEARYRHLLRHYGAGSLGYQGTWQGNTHWIAADGEGGIAYRVVGSVAIALSDPACLPHRRAQVMAEFIQFCDEHSWTPVFYSIHDDLLPIFAAWGWSRLSVGEETIIELGNFELVGKQWQKVRYPLNRGIKLGIQAVWTNWAQLSIGMANQIIDLSERWVAEKALPEMGFTLGGIEEIRDPEVALLLAVGPDGVLHGVTSWLPVYREGELSGWTLDFMRRSDDAMPGIMEFLIASAALRFQEEGAKMLSLSGAPLATAPVEKGEEQPESTVLSRLLDFLSRTLEPAYGFTSLFRFKAKFHPRYAGLWMVYPDALQFPRIGAALVRAYLPEMSPRKTLAFARALGTRPEGVTLSSSVAQ